MTTVTSDGTGPLDADSEAFVLAATGARRVRDAGLVQSLWSGFGQIRRLTLDGAPMPSAVLKLIDLRADGTNPRGWGGDVARRRKLRSYAIETHWYTRHAARCNDDCRVPRLLGEWHDTAARRLLLEDLDAGFPRRRERLSIAECSLCLHWLAAFHARFLGDEGDGLWPEGSYWHLATRQAELAAMADSPVRRAAGALDRALSACRFRTLVHGDAKLANFCFDTAMTRIAAVDFQYVGGGCGMRDVVYLLGSCLPGEQTARHEARLLDDYFGALADALARHGKGALAAPVEREWRALYAIAWTDFLRFLLGWMPTHAKVDAYSRALATRALDRIDGGDSP